MPDAGPDFRKFRIRKAAADFRRSFGRGAAQSCSLTNHAMALWQTTAFEPCRQKMRNTAIFPPFISPSLLCVPSQRLTQHYTGLVNSTNDQIAGAWSQEELPSRHVTLRQRRPLQSLRRACNGLDSSDRQNQNRDARCSNGGQNFAISAEFGQISIITTMLES